ncbi:MAG: response regulator, partial [Methylotenera sp.]|nr:response regulator [Methylotenera sp.]
MMLDQNKKILVVDDDIRLRELLQRYLTEQGFSVRGAADAKEMDTILANETIDLLVLDLMLPGEDGLSICRRIRGTGTMLPIVMLTARGDEVDRIIGLEMGADDYLPKPFNPRELLARINAVLRRHERIQPSAPAT